MSWWFCCCDTSSSSGSSSSASSSSSTSSSSGVSSSGSSSSESSSSSASSGSSSGSSSSGSSGSSSGSSSSNSGSSSSLASSSSGSSSSLSSSSSSSSSGSSSSASSSSLASSSSGSSSSLESSSISSSSGCDRLWIAVLFNGPSGGICSINADGTTLWQIGRVNEINGCSEEYGEYSFYATCADDKPVDCNFPNPFFSWFTWHQGKTMEELAADLGIPAECLLYDDPVPDCCPPLLGAPALYYGTSSGKFSHGISVEEDLGDSCCHSSYPVERGLFDGQIVFVSCEQKDPNMSCECSWKWSHSSGIWSLIGSVCK